MTFKKLDRPIDLRPHHLIDLVTAYGRNDERVLKDSVVRELIFNTSLKAKFVIGADDLCRFKPCKFLSSEGKCMDILGKGITKEKYNNELDRKILEYLGLISNQVITIETYLLKLKNKIPGIEKVCAHPRENSQLRLQYLKKGLNKIGIST